MDGCDANIKGCGKNKKHPSRCITIVSFAEPLLIATILPGLGCRIEILCVYQQGAQDCTADEYGC